MDNIEANKDNLTSLIPAQKWMPGEKNIVQSYLTLSNEDKQLQPEHGVMQPEHDAHGQNQEIGRRSEPMDLQREEISALANVKGTDPETSLTAQQDESSANHSSSSQHQSPKHNMPLFLARNIKKLIETHLKSTAETQGQQELNHLYLDFVQKNLKGTLKSLNRFCFISSQEGTNKNETQSMEEKFKESLNKELKRPELATDFKEEWSKSVQICQNYFQGFIFSNQAELLKLAQRRVFKERSKNAELVDYSERFLTNMRNGTPRGKDVKSRRSTQ